MKKMIEEAEKLGVEITTLLCPGALPDLTPPVRVVWGVAGAFRINRRFGGCEIRCYAGKCRSHLKYIFKVI